MTDLPELQLEGLDVVASGVALDEAAAGDHLGVDDHADPVRGGADGEVGRAEVPRSGLDRRPDADPGDRQLDRPEREGGGEADPAAMPRRSSRGRPRSGPG